MQFVYNTLIASIAITLIYGGDPNDKSQNSIHFGQADFAINMLKQLTDGDKTMLLSPFSISVALGMTLAGSWGRTKKQMIDVLAKGSNDEELHLHLIYFLKKISEKHDGLELRSGNRIYLNDKFNPKETYIGFINTYYNGEFKVANFSASQAFVKDVNSWIINQTNSKITEILSGNAVHPAAAMLLLNAIYFKGDWAKKFNENQTEKKSFRGVENKKRLVNMMHMKDNLPYMEDDVVQVLGLPYKNSNLSMYIFLPTEAYGLSKLMNKIDGAWLLKHIKECYPAYVDVELPRFKILSNVNLVRTLKNLGMVDAFTNKADFNTISNGLLKISDVIHKAFIEVNEQGTEAAAVTGVQLVRKSSPIIFPFKADHPFLFLIAAEKTILFIGTYC